MKTLRKIRKNAKALSPVVASIILIAVTVAVSIAVAAWMGALTVGFMGTEQVEMRTITFNSNSTVSVVLRNTGTSAVTIQETWINSAQVTPNSPTLPAAINANAEATYNLPLVWTAGNNYQIKVVTAKGNPFMKNAIPPT